MLSFKRIECGIVTLTKILEDVGMETTHGRVCFWDDLTFTVVKGYIIPDESLACYAVLSHDKKGVKEPYDGEIMEGFYWYLHWFQVQPSCQGKGYGRHFLSHLQENFECPILFESFVGTTSFYMKCGAFNLKSASLHEKEKSWMVLTSRFTKECFQEAYDLFWPEGTYHAGDSTHDYELCAFVSGKIAEVPDFQKVIHETDFKGKTRKEIVDVLLGKEGTVNESLC